jgi:hypothetical protein
MLPVVFEQVRFLGVYGSVASIQSDLSSSSFSSLSFVEIEVLSLANFLHHVGLDWATDLNNGTTLTFGEQTGFTLVDPGSLYNYPNQDLCLFAHLPLNANKTSVLPILNANLTECTDTMAWLTQNYNSYSNLTAVFLMTPYYSYSSIDSLCWNGTAKPNISLIQAKMKERCAMQKHQSVQGYKFYVDYYDVVYTFQFLTDLLAFVFIPVACVLGFSLNLRVIYTIHNNRAVELKEDFYEFMSLNSFVNCLFCVIYVLYPINYCLPYESGYFCSLVSTTITAQVYKIVFIGYFGEVLKMCSNIFYIFITINRYMLVGRDHSPALENVNTKYSLRLVVVVSVAFSFLMNIGHAFQYRINRGWEDLGGYELTDTLYPAIVIHNSLFAYYALVYFVVNFVLFLAVNTRIEWLLVKIISKEIAEKRAKLEKEILVSQSNNSSESKVVNKIIKSKKKKIEQDAKKETRAIMMVILNSVVNFYLRLPEILVFFSSFSPSFFIQLIVVIDLNLFSYSSLFSNMYSAIVSFSYLAYILTFTTNVVNYYLFNQKFKQLFVFWTTYVKNK